MRLDTQISEDTPSEYLDGLNPEQLEAVTCTEGPLLVLAGAGTGKTKVLTTRIANIINSRRAFPSQILAVTFTNKAAKEMRERLHTLVGHEAESVWLGTFHSIAAKILRMHPEAVGLTRDFTIIGMDDQLRIIKQMLHDFNIDEKKVPPKLISYLIGRYKDKAWLPGKVPESELEQSSVRADLNRFYHEYQNRLRQLNACDFGDLTLYNIKIFNEHEDIFERFQHKFNYVLVDEYQDTNVAQYIWLKLMSQHRQNICCVGDDDQSIYGWRGAEVTNILRFDIDYPNAKIIRLERNYRSTNYILKTAAKLISHNSDRHGKELWTDRQDGERIKLNGFYDEREEAKYIGDEIESLTQLHGFKHFDIAILMRAGYQSRGIEEMMNFMRIPYRIVGGMKFYERAEIKDAIAYIRLLMNESDALAFERIINVPRRGIGSTTTTAIRAAYQQGEMGNSCFQVAQNLIDSGVIKGKTAKSIQILREQFGKWRNMLEEMQHWDVVENMLQDSGFLDMFRDENTPEAKERLDNVKELISSLQDFTDLGEYLEHISLVTDGDNVAEENKVQIMTLHASKGLEFPAVFLIGWEEGVFPSARSMDEKGNAALEEERRLAYVGITRAKSKLYISYACNRKVFGTWQNNAPSRFIDELPSSEYEVISNYGRARSSQSREMLGERNIVQQIRQAIMPKATTTPKKTGLSKGDVIRHDKFGKGVVLDIKDGVVSIVFGDGSRRKIALKYLQGDGE
jgi:DNA helicase-2/ATP-dependent DNA helicase PcrA